MNFSGWKKSLTDAVSTAAVAASAAVSKASEVAKDIADDSYAIAIGAKNLRDYRVMHQISTGGPQSVWKVYSAANRNAGAVYPDVSVWVLEKKSIMDQHKSLKPKDFEPFFNLQKKDCGQLLRLRHPGVLRLIEPLEETRNQLVFVTEPIIGSLSCILSHFAGIPTAPTSSRELTLAPLEIKLGLLHLAETLSFLHNEAKLAHCALSPESIYLTADGGWKLSTFAHSVSADYASPNTTAQPFDFSLTSGPCDEMMKPPIGYVAPELVGGMAQQGAVTPAVDVFSLGAVAYELVVGRPAVPARSVQEYRQRVGTLSPVLDLPSVPTSFQSTLHAMLSTAPPSRPTASAFMTCPYFLEDVLLRALRFLDTILQREPSQKAAFLRDLATIWPQIEPRLLRHKVMPPLLQELKNEATQLAAFPLVLAIAQKQGRDEFMERTLPQIRPIFQTASGEMLLLLVRNSHTFASLMTTEAVGASLMPVFERAVEGNNPRLQEEVLRNLAQMADELPYPLLKEMLPKVSSICLRTTSAGVRASSCTLMARLAPRLNREESDQILDTITQVTSVDRTAGTLMATTALCDAISLQWGAEVTASRILPLLTSHLMASNLSGPQFSTLCKAIKEMVDRIEAKRLPELQRKAPVAQAAPAAAEKETSWDTPLPNSRSTTPATGAPSMSAAPSSSSLASSAPSTPSYPTPSSSTPSYPTPSSTTPSWATADLFTAPADPFPTPAAVPSNPAPPQNPPDRTWDWVSPGTSTSPTRRPPGPTHKPPQLLHSKPQPRPSAAPLQTPHFNGLTPSNPSPSGVSSNQPLPDLFGGLSVSPTTTGPSIHPQSNPNPNPLPSWDPTPSTTGPPAYPMGTPSMSTASSMGKGGAAMGGPSMGGPAMGGPVMGGPVMGMRPSQPTSMGGMGGLGVGLPSTGSGDMFGGLSLSGGGGGAAAGDADPFGSLMGGGNSTMQHSSSAAGDPFAALASGSAARPPMPQPGIRPPMGGAMGGVRPMGMRPPAHQQPPNSGGFGDLI